MMGCMSFVTYQCGDYVFRHGGASDQFVIIVTGSVAVELPGGQLIPRHQGDFFGERGLLKGSTTHSANVIVGTLGLRALEMSRKKFRALSSTRRSLYDVIMARLNEHIYDGEQELLERRASGDNLDVATVTETPPPPPPPPGVGGGDLHPPHPRFAGQGASPAG